MKSHLIYNAGVAGPRPEVEGRANTMTNPRRHVVLWLVLMIFFPFLAHAGDGKGQWVRQESSGSAPGFRLTDQDNRKVALGDFQGKVVLLSFIFTHCEAACPLATAKLASVHHEVKGKDVQIVSVTIDPVHDTPAVLKDYGKQYKGVDFRSWSFLTGTEDEVNDVLTNYKVAVERRGKRGPTGEVVSVSLVDHHLKVYLIDRKGTKRVEYLGQDFDPKVVIKDLTKVLDEKTG